MIKPEIRPGTGPSAHFVVLGRFLAEITRLLVKLAVAASAARKQPTHHNLRRE